MIKKIRIPYFKLAILAVGFLMFAACSSQSSPIPTASPTLTIDYLFTAEATYDKIQVRQSRLIHTYFEDADGKCTMWMAQVPCWTDQDLKTQETDLTEKEISDLIELIHQTSFMQLKNIYGGAPEGQRFYAYTLGVQLEDEKKEVLYQSFPESESMPEGFQRLSDRLHELVTQKFP